MSNPASDLNSLFSQAVSLHNAGNVKEAIFLYEKLLRISPKQPVIYLYLGNALQSLQCFEEAIASYDQAILLNPNFIDAYRNRGIILNQLNRFDEALVSFQKSIQLDSNQPMLHFGMGNILGNLKRFEEAVESYNKAIFLKVDYVEAYCNRGVALENLKCFEQALKNYDPIIALKIDCADAYSNKAFLQLALGDYESGWQLHEWRWKSVLKEHVRKFSEPLWLGDGSISGKTILIYAEQGLGDVIQFCRYVRMAKDLGANIILEVYSPLIPLLSTLKSDITIIEKGARLPSFDFQCPIMSLPLAFKTTLESIPADVPYLFSNPDKQKLWKKCLGVKTKKRIGLVCSGSTTYADDAKRSIPLHLVKPLLALPFEFHLLQKEIRVGDEECLKEHSQIQTHVNNFADFSDTAALIAEMDLVISVDTSIAHLAGALGHPVWILLPWKPDWRWLLDRTDSPWYPTATLFRQSEVGNWEGVIADVCERLMTRE